MRLKGKTALIAGASRNIGKEIALTFAREGAEVIAVSRQHGEELKRVAEECASHAFHVLSRQSARAGHDEARHGR